MGQTRDNMPFAPDGWTAKFDDEYKTWFFIQMSTKKSQWEAPPGTTWKLGAASIDPPPDYSNRPRSEPPAQRQAPAFQQCSQRSAPQPAYPAYAPQQPAYPAYPAYPPPQPAYPAYPPQPAYPAYPPQPVYAAPYAQPQTVIIEERERYHNRGGGYGGALAGAGVGLIGGALLADAFRPDETVVVDNNYYDDGGYDDGFDGGWDDY